MPEPVLVSIATAVATKAALDLYGLVKRRFERDPEAEAALDAAAEDPDDRDAVVALADQIERVGRLDPEFDRAVRVTWDASTTTTVAQDDGVVNQISGGAVGRAVQARDVHGDVNL
jgi:hypothetical protein